MSRPTLLGGGKPIPFHELSADDFARFVHGALVELGPHVGFRVEGLPGPGGDDGFDAVARTIPDDEVVCIQCKHTPRLTLSMVGLELAKLAMTSALRGTRVVAQYFVCSGAVQKEVDRAERANDRSELLQAAVSQATNHGDLSVRREELNRSGRDYLAIVRTYVANLRRIVVWSAAAFDAKLGVVMSRLEVLIDHYFRIATVLREHPRPDFDEGAYLESLTEPDHAATLQARAASTPPNLRLTAQSTRPGVTRKPAKELLLECRPGELIVLVGPGGSGKSTTVASAAAMAARLRKHDPGNPLPVVLPLKEYRGSLDTMIHAELGIHHGHWKSLPGVFLLLLDGLNELPIHDAQRAVKDLDVASKDRRVSAAITLRGEGLSGPVRVNQRCECWVLEALSMRDVRRIAKERLPPDLVAPFIIAVRERVGASAGASLFTLPFAVDGAAIGFSRRGALSKTLYEIVDDILRQRYERNEEIETSRDGLRIRRSTLNALAGEIAFQLYIAKGRQAASDAEMEVLVHRARTVLVSDAVFGADALTDTSSLDALVRYEVLVRSKGEGFSFAHEIVTAFLAARRLAFAWREHVASVPFFRRPDVWLFAGHLLPKHDQSEFLQQLAMQDTYVAAEVANACGLEVVAEPVLLAMEGSALRNDVDTWTWLCALARLNTPACRHKLNILSLLQTMQGDAVRARAIMGDVAILSAILDEADRMFGFATGGELDIWDTAPPQVALQLARARVDSAAKDARLGASAQTLARFGDQTDVDRLESLIGSRDPTSRESFDAVRFAAEALFALDEDATRRALGAAISRCGVSGRVVLSRLLVTMGGVVNVDTLIRLLLAEETEAAFVNAPEYERDGICRVAADALAMVELSDAEVRRLRDGVEKLPSGREYVWDVAAAQRSEVFDELAMSISAALVHNDDLDVGAVCGFALRRHWTEEQRQQFTSCIRIFANRGNAKFTWDLARALEYLWAQDERAVVGEVLREHVSAWLDAYKSVKDGSPIGLAVGNPRRRRLALPTTDTTSLELLLSWFLDIIADAASELSIEQCLALFLRDRVGSSNRTYSRLFAWIPTEQLDAALVAIPDSKKRAIALAEIAPLGETPTRIRILLDCLDELVYNIRYRGELERTALLLWSPELAAGFVELLARMKWDDPNAAMTENSLMIAGFPIDRGQVSKIIEPALSRQLHHRSRNVLLLWARKGRRRSETEE